MFPLEKNLKNHPLTDEFLEKAIRMMIPMVRNDAEEKDFREMMESLIRRAWSMAKERRSL